MPPVRRLSRALGLFLLLVALLATLVLPPASLTDAPLVVRFLDVGQGDAILIQAPGGSTALIDGGEVGSGVLQHLGNLGVQQLDLMVATHPHADHIGGLIEVLDAIPVAQVVTNGQVHTTSTYEDLLDAIAAAGSAYREVRRGDMLQLGTLTLEVLNPTSSAGTDYNNGSVVLRLVYGQVAFLFTGDAESEAETSMLVSGRPLEAKILKVGHHGSRSSSSTSFLVAVRPEVAVISVGASNVYGHPHPEALNRLAAVGSVVYRTDRDGTVTVTTNGVTYSVYLSRASWAWYGYLPLALRNAGPVVPASTPTPTPTPYATPTPTTTPSSGPSLRISDIRYSGSDEYVEITNSGPGAQVMTGWRIWSVVGDQWYTFPAGYTLAAGAYVRVHSGPGAINDPPADLRWTGSYIWNNEGDEARLINPVGQTVDSWAY